MMTVLDVELQLITPAFLGGSDQTSEWRSPPFKALLRQWWRIAVAGEMQYDHAMIRQAEGAVFGHAWLKSGHGRSWSMRSRVQLRLAGRPEPSLRSWPDDRRVTHPEVRNPVGAHLYLGYGPLTYDKAARGTALKAGPAVAPGSVATLRMRFPQDVRLDEFTTVDMGRDMDRVLSLIHLFGSIGGRSRNGWGSIVITNLESLGLDPSGLVLPDLANQPLSECLQREFPHALGADSQGPLLWRTRHGFDSAADALDALAEVKIAFRTSLPLARGEDIAARHLLAYPITHHKVRAWGNQSRLANQIRFKVHPVNQEGRERFVAIAYHLPHGIPGVLLDKLRPDERRWIRDQQIEIWESVHRELDSRMERWPWSVARDGSGP